MPVKLNECHHFVKSYFFSSTQQLNKNCFITPLQEERRTLRQPLVEIFGCICGLQKEMLSQLLCSVLPTELAIDIMNRKDGKSCDILTCW